MIFLEGAPIICAINAEVRASVSCTRYAWFHRAPCAEDTAGADGITAIEPLAKLPRRAG